ncbi:uncharacterized protein LOC121177264 isoform X2 [Toxotes jaculatrix]|uniref:uncharacterized protein LOC121177264 isoform X2 n=1 Tax=Toxotes jaculatrix TaxID=941984 RepID=UPI001B3AFDF9|nr:uncharacterized protein LOC121177264 isoform X2 [Toxotes jaculatrix]
MSRIIGVTLLLVILVCSTVLPARCNVITRSILQGSKTHLPVTTKSIPQGSTTHLPVTTKSTPQGSTTHLPVTTKSIPQGSMTHLPVIRKSIPQGSKTHLPVIRKSIQQRSKTHLPVTIKSIRECRCKVFPNGIKKCPQPLIPTNDQLKKDLINCLCSKIGQHMSPVCRSWQPGLPIPLV